MTGQNMCGTPVHVAGHDGSADGHRRSDAHTSTAVGTGQPVDGHSSRTAQTTCAVDGQASSGATDLVVIAADVLDDLERIRIATENRLRSLTHETVEGERGGWFGKGIDPEATEVRRVETILDGLRALEHQAELDLCRAMRKHPLGDWVKRTVGVGEKQAARLLAAIGDPGSRRTVSQLWAYAGYHVINPGQRCSEPQSGTAGDPTDQPCSDAQSGVVGGEALGPSHKKDDAQGVAAGADPSLGDHPGHAHHDGHRRIAGVAPKRRRGVRANWSSTAKMRAYLVAESCIKQMHSPYRAVYDAGRAKYADAVHAHPCERCGPSGKPAPVGSPLSDGHKHARAMRLVAKKILKDLWVEARTLAGHGITEAHSPCAGEGGSSGADHPLADHHVPRVGAADSREAAA